MHKEYQYFLGGIYNISLVFSNACINVSYFTICILELVKKYRQFEKKCANEARKKFPFEAIKFNLEGLQFILRHIRNKIEKKIPSFDKCTQFYL